MSTQLKVGFHLTSSHSVESILRDGLEPKCSGLACKLGETECGIHVFRSLNALRAFMPVVLADWNKSGHIAVLAVVLNDQPIAENRGPSLVFKQKIHPSKIAVIDQPLDDWIEGGFKFTPEEHFFQKPDGFYISDREAKLLCLDRT